ncbi:MAG: C10 family peptidase [Bacteroidia bacterium]|nr:C10 family peptidase [Bacteroidia bacterium]
MKAAATLSFCLLLLTCNLFAEPVDEGTARKAAVRWMLTHGGGEAPAYSVRMVYPLVSDNLTTCYIVNLAPEGVVVISADDVAVPVLMYTSNGSYDGSTLPDGLASLLRTASEEIASAVAKGLEAPVETKMRWRELLDENGVSNLGSGSSVMAVSPLLTTTWNQNSPYNKFCPPTSTGGSGGYVYAGCVATAMAQVMRYYNAPTTGQGSYSYVHPTYGLQSANFGATTYQWANMPNSISGSSSSTAKDAIAQLIYHCAVSVDMDFSPTGSGATTQDARAALVNYFRYSSSATHVWKNSYSSSAWTSLLTSELNSGRPMIYRGSASNGSGGHAWVLDGFSGTDYFHMNYGWGGYLDGYFYLNDITPGSNIFTYYQGAVIGIQPQTIATPTLSSPSHQATNICVTPTLVWNASSGADSYHLQVSTASSFATTVVDQPSLTGTSYAAGPLSMGVTYYWRVRATGTAGTSAWSSARSFTTRNVTISASGPVVLCSGGSVTLSTASGSGVSYTWWRDGMPISGASQATLLVSTSGSYVVGVTQSGCTTTSDPMVVTVHQQPAAVILTGPVVEACEGAGELLTAQQVTGASYLWKRDGTPIPGATTSMWTATEAGLYTVTVTVGTCATESAPTSVTLHPLDPTLLVWTGAISSRWNDLGNWDNPCALPGSGDDVVIPAGTQPPASVPFLTLHNLTLNNSTGTALGGTLYITGSLILQAGSLELGDHDLILSATASIAGGSSGSHIATTGSGSLLVENIGAGGRSGTIVFPVGSGSSYTPLSMSNTAPACDFSVRVLDGVQEHGLSGPAISNSAVNRTWIISGSSQSNVSLTLQWNAGDELSGFDRALCAISRNDIGMFWDPLQAAGAASGNGPYTRSVSGLTTISQLGMPLAIGSGQGLYPVRFLTFSAARMDEKVVLHWRTADEVNNHGFFVERRESGSTAWRQHGFVPASMGSNSEHSYSWIDDAPSTAALQYRLRQIDTDGSVAYSAMIDVSAEGAATAVSLSLPSPHPLVSGQTASVRFTLPSPSPCRLLVFDVLGREAILTEARDYPAGESMIMLDTQGLRPGAYLLVLDRGGQRTARGVVVTK